jgi:hypothetical protein
MTANGRRFALGPLGPGFKAKRLCAAVFMPGIAILAQLHHQKKAENRPGQGLKRVFGPRINIPLHADEPEAFLSARPEGWKIRIRAENNDISARKSIRGCRTTLYQNISGQSRNAAHFK